MIEAVSTLTSRLPFLKSARIWNVLGGSVCIAFCVMWRFPLTLAMPIFGLCERQQSVLHGCGMHH